MIRVIVRNINLAPTQVNAEPEVSYITVTLADSVLEDILRAPEKNKDTWSRREVVGVELLKD